jgi:hypothetical protein
MPFNPGVIDFMIVAGDSIRRGTGHGPGWTYRAAVEHNAG